MVRAFVGAMLSAWHMDSLTEDAELIASELASNAVAASTDSDGQPVYISGHMPVVQVCLLTDGVRTLLEVWDQAPGIPVIRDAAGCEESGRGLVLIDAIADRWGWSPATGRPGKVVWAEMSLLLQGCLVVLWRPCTCGWSLKRLFLWHPRTAEACAACSHHA
jgi:anti-sigma regulatory factor (Ser/Thr protein kinase)